MKLILQPFVENAILHGLSAQTSGIHITVAAEREGADLLFTVADDGVGIAEERLRQLTGRAHKGNGEMVGHESAAEGGYGVVNVDNRIRTYFGEPYGVSIASAPGEGTVVTLRLPLLDTPPSDG